MENTNIIKQAKSDIFKELYPIIKFYIQKGAKPASLKKYYKNTKRFLDLIDDIKNKGVNLVKDENEYKSLVRDVLNEILDDFIAKEKDEEYKNKQKSKMKHIKEFNHFEEINENFVDTLATTISYTANFFIIGYLLYKFLIKILPNVIKLNDKSMIWLFKSLLKTHKLPVSDTGNEYIIEYEIDDNKSAKIIISKIDKTIKTYRISNVTNDEKVVFESKLTDNQFEDFIKIIRK